MKSLKTASISTAILVTILGTVGAQGVLEKGQVQPNDKDKTLLNDVEEGRGRMIKMSDKWIGVLCRPVDDVLRSHLNLDEGIGLVIERVVPNSPADRVGLERHDILTQVSGADLTSIQVLAEATSNADDEGFELTRVRRGERDTVKITPEQRPGGVGPFARRAPAGENIPEVGRLREWVEQLERGLGEDREKPFNLRFFGPGVPMQGDELPDGMSIQIQKEDNEPAKITVQKDDKTWEVTEETLHELPEDIRPTVQGMLQGGGGIRMRGLENIPWPQFDRRLENMDDQLREMMEELRKLREQSEEPEDDSIDA